MKKQEAAPKVVSFAKSVKSDNKRVKKQAEKDKRKKKKTDQNITEVLFDKKRRDDDSPGVSV